MAAEPTMLSAPTSSGALGAASAARLRAFLTWWRAELLAALPQSWRERLPGGAAGIPIMLLPDEVVAFGVQGGRLVERTRVQSGGQDGQARAAAVRQLMAQQDRAADAWTILLPAGSFVRKSIELPLAAEESLRQVIGFELDRHTPFKAAHAEFDVRVLGRTRDNANIRVEFVAAPRSIVQAMRQQAEALGLRIASISPFIEDSGWREFDLLPHDASARKGLSPALRLNLAIGATFLVLLGAALAVPILQKRDAAIRLLPKLDEARAESEKVQKTRSELEKLVTDANFLLGKKYAQVPATQLVEDLSRIFPDTTWIAALEVKAGKQRELVLTGETASATRVVEMLEQIPYLKNPTFRSPLSKTPGQVAERFVIAAEFKPRPLPTSSEAAPTAVPNAAPNPTPAPTSPMTSGSAPAASGPAPASQGVAPANSAGQPAAPVATVTTPHAGKSPPGKPDAATPAAAGAAPAPAPAQTPSPSPATAPPAATPGATPKAKP